MRLCPWVYAHTNKDSLSLQRSPPQAPSDLYVHSWVCVSSWSKDHVKPVYRCASEWGQSSFAIPSDLMFWLRDIAKKELTAGAGTDGGRHSELLQTHSVQKRRTGYPISTDSLEGYNLRLCRLPGCDSGLHPGL